MNYYDNFDWNKILQLYPSQYFSISDYHKILSPEFPDFLNKYLELPLLKRLSGIGLLCGTDWTKLYKNRFYYSRLDHSLGVALIIWNFTHNKAQTISGLLHDVSTPVFSHVSDFRKGDALTQTATEEDNTNLVRQNKQLLELLKQDGLTVEQVENYHIYPIADNEIPQLSADRLEYMFPSGAALEGSWSLEQIRKVYNDIIILTNEADQEELGFKNLESAELYCYKFCMTGQVLQLNENKLTLHLLGQIMNKAVEAHLLEEKDFMTLSEKEILNKLEVGFTKSFSLKNLNNNQNFSNKTAETVGTDPLQSLFRLYKTFRTMTRIEHTSTPLPAEEYFCVSLKVKQRYINPLVKTEKGAARLNTISKKSDSLIKDFLSYQDSAFGCVKLI